MAKKMDWEGANRKQRKGMSPKKRKYMKLVNQDQRLTEAIRAGRKVYIYSLDLNKKVHIATFIGTICELETFGGAIFHLRERTFDMPPGRSLCHLCKINKSIKSLQKEIIVE